ncbi:succinylarginine dihydrolase, partial [Pseudomonas syringae]
RLHGLSEAGVAYSQQNPAVIDQGVFHNDVIAVGNGEVLFYHQDPFLNTEPMLDELRDKLSRVGGQLRAICVPRAEVSVQDAVRSYLFNSQLLSRADGSLLLIVPQECQAHASVWAYLQRLIAADSPVAEVKVFDPKQSMQHGGGPACRRSRGAATDTAPAQVT